MAWEQGDTFEVAERDPSLDNHVWIILSDPQADRTRIVCVNLTTWREGKDPTCIILAGTHARVTRDSCIPYNRTMLRSINELERLFGSGMIRLCGPASPALLGKILVGAAQTDDMPTDCRSVLVQQELI